MVQKGKAISLESLGKLVERPGVDAGTPVASPVPVPCTTLCLLNTAPLDLWMPALCSCRFRDESINRFNYLKCPVVLSAIPFVPENCSVYKDGPDRESYCKTMGY